jgi:hypothetical protein
MEMTGGRPLRPEMLGDFRCRWIDSDPEPSSYGLESVVISQHVVQRCGRLENLGQVRDQVRIEEGFGESDQFIVDVPVT